ncbi:hypothetical protein BDZ45DRAFT_648126, partial [Acephala macrosclerotiorum]
SPPSPSSSSSPHQFLTLPIKVNRFARRSRSLHHLDIIGDDVSSLASSSVASSTASTPRSSIIGSLPDSFTNHPSPSPSPPVARITPSTRAPSTTSTSTLFTHLANQRRPSGARPSLPPPPPPLIVNQNTSANNQNPSSQVTVGADGRNRLTRRNGSGSSSGSGGSGSGNGRRVSRRASFFSLLRGSGD